MSIDPRHHHTPSWRKPAGMFAILAMIAGWAALVGSLSPMIGRWPMLAQAPAYLFLGIVWIWLLPLRRMLQWMETGVWRKPR
jgi:hypothetical protein